MHFEQVIVHKPRFQMLVCYPFQVSVLCDAFSSVVVVVVVVRIVEVIVVAIVIVVVTVVAIVVVVAVVAEGY